MQHVQAGSMWKRCMVGGETKEDGVVTTLPRLKAGTGNLACVRH